MRTPPSGTSDQQVVSDVASSQGTGTRSVPPPALRPGAHVADVDGARLAYTVRGTGPVLLLPSPGWGPSVRHLLPLPVLERHCTVVYVDSRHSGASTGPERADRYSLDHLVADLEALRVHLGSPPVFLAGHGTGGTQALAYGIEHGEHLLGVLALDVLVAADQERFEEMLSGIWRRREGPFHEAHPSYVDDALVLMMGLDTGLSARQVLDRTAALYFAEPALAATALPRLDVDERLVALSREAGFGGRDLLPDLHRVEAPVLLVTGADDVVCGPVSQAGRAHDRLPRSTLAVLAGCGHFPWVEQPAAFDAAVEAWFAGLAT
jgi:proline iminopeptidase